MNIEIFVIFSLICAFSVWISYLYPSIGSKGIAGLFLVILGVSLLGGLDYKVGETTTNTYDLNETIFENITTTNGSVIENVTPQRENYNNLLSKGISIIIAMSGILLLFYDDDREINRLNGDE